MKHFFKWLGKHIAGAMVFSLFSILFIAGIVYAITYPSAPPQGETAGGKFTQYFNNILQSCPVGSVIKGYTSTGSKVCTDKIAKADSLINENCGAGKALQGFTSTGARICTVVPKIPPTGDVLYANRVIFTDYPTALQGGQVSGDYATYNAWIEEQIDQYVASGSWSPAMANNRKKLCRIGLSASDKQLGKYEQVVGSRDMSILLTDDVTSRWCGSIICAKFKVVNQIPGPLIMQMFQGNCRENTALQGGPVDSCHDGYATMYYSCIY